ncbi:serine/threonine protein kinase [Myxococcota bacterium]|nr:serine/threonine protein kinase [Myxococcota bacterium]
MICARCHEEIEAPHPEALGDLSCPRCGQAPLVDGRYRLDAVVGQGALGTVYRALEIHRQEIVAIKALPLVHGHDHKRLELIQREIDVLTQLRHPQIAGCQEHVVLSQGPERVVYLVLAFIDGETLAEEMTHTRYHVDGVLAILQALLEILAYLHTLAPPVIHRDIKPGNVMRRRSDAQLVLVDFGSVRDTLHDPKLGGSTVTGSFGYMAPEQFAGEAGPETDIYGLGALAVALLSRRAPSTMMGTGWGLAWRDYVQVNPAVEALLARMLEPDRGRRAADAGALRAEIERLRAGEVASPLVHAAQPLQPLSPPASIAALTQVSQLSLPRPWTLKGAWRRLKQAAVVGVALCALAGLWVYWPAMFADPVPGPTLEAIRAEALSEHQRLKRLGALSPSKRAELDQWMYLIELRSVSGNEDNIQRLIHRFEREFAQPVVLKAAQVEAVVAEMKRQAAARVAIKGEGYDTVRAIIEPILATLPSPAECLRGLVMSNEERFIAAFLVNEYFGGDHYHRYNRRQEIFRWLISGPQYRPWSLPVIEEVLRESYVSSYSDSEYILALKAARPIVGGHFEAWYEDVRGAPYRWEQLNAWMPWSLL